MSAFEFPVAAFRVPGQNYVSEACLADDLGPVCEDVRRKESRR